MTLCTRNRQQGSRNRQTAHDIVLKRQTYSAQETDRQHTRDRQQGSRDRPPVHKRQTEHKKQTHRTQETDVQLTRD